MRNLKKPFVFITTTVLVLLLLGCSSRSADISGTGVKSALVQGEIQSVGSIVVNGTRYLTDSATAISIDGETADNTALQVGMVVELKVLETDLGRDGARAQSVAFRAAVQGPIEIIDVAAGELEVLGRQIRVDDLTRVFDSSGDRLAFAELVSGDVVRVSGYALDDATIQATLLARRDNAALVAHGVVRDLDPAAQQFRLGTALVDYRSLGDINLSDGDRIRVRGQRGERDRLIAQSVEILPDEQRLVTDRPGSVDGALGVIETGSQCPSLRFSLGDSRVTLTPQTRFESLGCAELAPGQRLVVTGRFTATGALLAEELRALRPPNASLRAAIEAIDTGNASRRCSLTVLGDLLLEVAPDTRLDGPDRASDGAQRSPGCAELRVGSAIQAVGHYAPTATSATPLSVARLGVAATDAAQLLAGPVQSLDRELRQLQVLNTTVQFDDRTRFADGGEAAFFDRLRPGVLVLISGQWDGQQLRAATAGLRAARSVDAEPTRPGDG